MSNIPAHRLLGATTTSPTDRAVMRAWTNATTTVDYVPVIETEEMSIIEYVLAYAAVVGIVCALIIYL